MPTATLERFPKTVSACHAEIIRLRNAATENDDTDTRVEELETERDELLARVSELQSDNGKLEDRIEELEEAETPDATSAIDQFLYEVERPVGEFKFDVIRGAAADRAILGLFAAVGRQP